MYFDEVAKISSITKVNRIECSYFSKIFLPDITLLVRIEYEYVLNIFISEIMNLMIFLNLINKC